MLVFAEEDSDIGSSDDFSQMIKNYNENQFGKIISDKEYQHAIQTKENYIKKRKKKKKEILPKEEPAYLDRPSVKETLLVIPADVVYENKIIPSGFYLVNLKRAKNKYFLELKQGNNSAVASIEATGNIININKALQDSAAVEKLGEDRLKINYVEGDLLLEAILWKY